MGAPGLRSAFEISASARCMWRAQPTAAPRESVTCTKEVAGAVRPEGRAHREVRRREVRQEVCFNHREGKTSILKKVRGMMDNDVNDSSGEMMERRSWRRVKKEKSFPG